MRIEIATKHFPRLTAWHVRKALKWINPADLCELECVRLMDHDPEGHPPSKKPPYLTGFLNNGYYFRKKKNRPASIVLYTQDLYFPIPSVFAPTPMASLRIASWLAHEIGHHVIVTQGYNSKNPDLKPKTAASHLVNPEIENMADTYAFEVANRMLCSWYYKSGRLLARMLSYVYFQIGNHLSWRGNFKRAASLEFSAYMLNHENSDAWQNYLLDRQALVTKTPNALTDEERLWVHQQKSVG